MEIARVELLGRQSVADHGTGPVVTDGGHQTGRGASACRHHGLIEPLATDFDLLGPGQQGLAGDWEPGYRVAEIDGSVAQDQQPHRLGAAAVMNALAAVGLDRVPPHPAGLERAGDDHAVGDRQDAGHVGGRGAGADQDREDGRGLDGQQLGAGSGIAGALAGGDHRIGTGPLQVTGQLGQAAVGGDRMRAVLDVAVGEDRARPRRDAGR